MSDVNAPARPRIGLMLLVAFLGALFGSVVGVFVAVEWTKARIATSMREALGTSFQHPPSASGAPSAEPASMKPSEKDMAGVEDRLGLPISSGDRPDVERRIAQRVQSAPLAVTSVKVKDGDYGRKSAWARVKNVGQARISAYKIRFYGFNAFGERVALGSGANWLQGIAQDNIAPGKENTAEWEIGYGAGPVSHLVAEPYQVLYADDGGTWELGK